MWTVISGPFAKGLRIPDGPSLECAIVCAAQRPLTFAYKGNVLTVWMKSFGRCVQYMTLVKE